MGTFFIHRPVFAAVISIIITLVGYMALKSTPITSYPDINPPTVSVSANYPGATAEVVANTVATPLEQAINGVEGMMYMTSRSYSSGAMSISVNFNPGTDPDQAQINVQNKVQALVATLPEPVQRSVTVSKKSDTMLMGIALSSPDNRYDPLYLADYASLYLLDPIKRVPGASSASMIPNRDPDMKIWLNPEQMARFKLGAQEVSAAIRRQSKAYSVGNIGQSPAPPGTQQTLSVATKGMLATAAEFGEIIVRAGEGTALVKLKDLARVELAGDSTQICRVNGKPAVVILVNQQSGANAITVSNEVNSLIKSLKPNLPAGLELKVLFDMSTFTRKAIDEVLKTFGEATILVVLVVFLFLQSFRATIIPILAVPIAIVGAFIGIYPLGFSINMLTLFGLILAIGLVVDDAIIVVEKVEQNMATLHLSPFEATARAMRELTGSLVAIVLVLGAVFVPVAFLNGATGTLYKQFAVTIAISMVFSGVVALTLSPALAARLLRVEHGEKQGFFRWFERGFNGLTSCYLSIVRWLLRHRVMGIILYAGVLAATVGLFSLVPTSFVPDEDMGYFNVVSVLPESASLERTVGVSDRVLPLLRANPVVTDVLQLDGYGGGSNFAVTFVALKPYEQRTTPGTDVFNVMGGLRSGFGSVKEGIVLPLNQSPLQLGTGEFEFYLKNQKSGSPREMEQIARAFEVEARKRPELTAIRSDFTASLPQLFVDVDRSRAELMGVQVDKVFETLQAYFATFNAGQFIRKGRVCWVTLQADARFRARPEDLTRVHVPSTSGDMVPLATVATVSFVPGPGELPHYNGFPSVIMKGAKAPGFSSGQAIGAMEEVARKVLPDGYSFEWAGQELEEKKSASTSTKAIVLGLLMVFLILAAQFESWALPLGVVLSVPFAVCGAFVFSLGRGLPNDVFFRVGLLMLIGLSAKNAILIIQFAAENARAGMTPVEAAMEAARLRFRPIVMTSLAFILGCVPMAIAGGAGANSQHAIGTGVIGGMLASTLVATCFVPLFFVLLEEGSARLMKRKRVVAVAEKEADHA